MADSFVQLRIDEKLEAANILKNIVIYVIKAIIIIAKLTFYNIEKGNLYEEKTTADRDR